MKHTLRDYIGSRELYAKMFRIAIPVSVQMLITVGINLMDTIMLSSMGDEQLSASTLAGQFINFFQICCMGIGMGASVLSSRFWGRRDNHSLKKTITIMLRFCFVFSLVFTMVTIFFPRTIMLLYSNDEEIIAYGMTYLKWLIPTYFLMGFSLTCTLMLRSVEQVVVPLVSTIISFFVNVFFNWVFIFGNLGAPRMEIAGAALGTLIARTVEFCTICGFMFLADQRIRYRLKDLTMKCRDLLGEYFRLSIPVLVSDSLLALGNNAVSMVMGHISKAFVAANTETVVVQQLCSVLTQGIANASGIITGHTMGRGETDQAQKDGYAFFAVGLAVGILAAVLIYFSRGFIINYYKVSDEAREIAWHLMDAILIIVIFQSMNSVLTKGVLRAGGDTKFLMAGDILFLWIASIPLGICSGLIFHWPPFWTYFCLKIDQVIKCVWCYFRLRSGKWRKKISDSYAPDYTGS